jgi:hypothetical protein
VRYDWRSYDDGSSWAKLHLPKRKKENVMGTLFLCLVIVMVASCVVCAVTRLKLSDINEQLGYVANRCDWSQEARDDRDDLCKQKEKWIRVENITGLVLLAALLTTIIIGLFYKG